MLVGQKALLLLLLAAVMAGTPALADSPPPGMIEIDNVPPPPPPRLDPIARWWRNPHRRPVGVDVYSGVSCLTVYCYGLVRVGFEFGWGEIHIGGLMNLQPDTEFNPFSHLAEDGGWNSGIQIGAEVGSPYMRVARRVRVAVRGAIDHDLFFASYQGPVWMPAMTGNVAVAVDLGRGFSFVARAGVGFAPAWNAILDGGAGLIFAR